MPVVVEVLCGRHFFIENPNCFTQFTHQGQTYSTDTHTSATSPKWEKNKFELDHDDKALKLHFEVMTRQGRSPLRIASVTVEWPNLQPGVHAVDDYVVKPEAAGVKDTAAIRVACTLTTGWKPKGEPTRKALFVGICYKGTPHVLPQSDRDAEQMKVYLCDKWGFVDSPEHTKLLKDGAGSKPETKPTKSNIRAALSWLAHDAVAGDSLLFFYSGHGSQKPNLHDREKDGFDEALVPCDVDENGVLVDDEINELLVQPLPERVRLTCILDCCHSGSGLDLAYRWSPYMTEKGWKLDKGGYYSNADVICISGCADDQTSTSVPILGLGRPENLPQRDGMPSGLCAASLCVAMEVHQEQCKMNWMEMLNIMATVLKDMDFKQEVQLSSSQKFDLTRQFGFHDCIPNSNKFRGAVDGGDGGHPFYSARNLLQDEKFMSNDVMVSMQRAGLVQPLKQAQAELVVLDPAVSPKSSWCCC